MKVYNLMLGVAVSLAMVTTVALANPTLMQKNKPGYPYPGTVAKDVFGGSALNQSVIEENRLEGVLPGQAGTPTGTISSKSLLPPEGDPLRISPSPNLEKEGFPLYGPDKRGSTAK